MCIFTFNIILTKILIMKKLLFALAFTVALAIPASQLDAQNNEAEELKMDAETEAEDVCYETIWVPTWDDWFRTITVMCS